MVINSVSTSTAKELSILYAFDVVVITVNPGATEPTGFDLVGQIRQLLVGRDSFSLLTIVPATAMPNSSDLRQVFAEGMQSLRDQIKASAIVILGDGIWASTARTFIRSMATINRTSYPRAVFETVGDAAAWLATHNGALDSARLLDEIKKSIQLTNQ